LEPKLRLAVIMFNKKNSDNTKIQTGDIGDDSIVGKKNYNLKIGGKEVVAVLVFVIIAIVIAYAIQNKDSNLIDMVTTGVLGIL